MKLIYLLDGERIETEQSDENVTISLSETTGRCVARVEAHKTITLIEAVTVLEHPIKKGDLVFANGYQSWTETREFAYGEGLNDLNRLPAVFERLFSFKAYGSQGFFPTKKADLAACDLFYIKGKDPLFIGSYNYKNAYLFIRAKRKEGRIELHGDLCGKTLLPGESFTVLDYLCSGDISCSLEAYCGALKPKNDRKLFGYTSWYNHYQNIDRAIIEKALCDADDRFDLFQIDDGFETHVGDWLEADAQKFPEGLSPIIEKIHQKGMLAGIWLAPFVAEKRSALFREHPDWIRRDESGEPVFAGSNWSGFAPLDLENPEAVAYIRRVLRTWAERGFDFFKLDFLYAASLIPMKGKTRAETTEFAYGIITEEIGDKLILGCGAVVSSSFEKFDYLRIGPDVSLSFDDAVYMRLFHPERVSTKVTLLNTIFRSPLNGRAFGCDPDVFLLRDENIRLTDDQRYALTRINALFGALLMTSDNPKTYDQNKARVLNDAYDLNRNAKVLSYERRKNGIEIRYELGGKEHAFTYLIKKGVIRDER